MPDYCGPFPNADLTPGRTAVGFQLLKISSGRSGCSQDCCGEHPGLTRLPAARLRERVDDSIRQWSGCSSRLQESPAPIGYPKKHQHGIHKTVPVRPLPVLIRPAHPGYGRAVRRRLRSCIERQRSGSARWRVRLRLGVRIRRRVPGGRRRCRAAPRPFSAKIGSADRHRRRRLRYGSGGP